MDLFESTIIKREVAEESESESSDDDDDIQSIRVKQEQGEKNKSGPLFEVIPKVERIDVVIESSEEDNDDEKDEDWSLEKVESSTKKRPTRKRKATVRNPSPPKQTRSLRISSGEDEGETTTLNGPKSKSKQKKSTSKTSGKKSSTRKLKQCGICGSMFKALTRHIATHTDNRPHKCSDCPKSFRRKWDLDTHRRTHTGEKPFKCEFCPIAYQRKAHLEKHVLEEHVVDKEFPCKQCEKAFISQQQLNAHIKCFHQRINYYRHSCHLCSRPYREIQELKNHLGRVHSRVSYCKHCRNSFYTEKDHTRHLIPEKKPFSCLECHKTFTTVCLFRLHSETHPGSGYVNESPDEKDASYIGRALPRKTSAKIREKNISKRKSLLLHSQMIPEENDETHSDD